jgi:hypothetical protein
MIRAEMKRIWCAISSHGFGHAAQVVPVLNELGRRVSGLTAILRTSVPARLFEANLQIAWEVSPAEQDVGCVQQGPIRIDVAATWAEHRRFHEQWEDKVAAEVRAIRSCQPALVLADISYLAIEAAAHAGVPAVGLCNLSWDGILKLWQEPNRHEQVDVIRRIQESYSLADLMIRIAPGIPMEAFRAIVDVGPVAELATPDPSRLRAVVGADAHERVVLVAFGGIALDGLPFDRLARMNGYRFVVSGPVPDGTERIRSSASIPMAFGSLLASADLIVTKPGYSTVVKAVAYRKPVVYVRRYNFADEAVLVDYLHRHGSAVELSADDFRSGGWDDALHAAGAVKGTDLKSVLPAPTGATEAADLVMKHLST